VPEVFTGTIERPGLYPDIPEADYHRDPVAHEWGSLSSTGAKLLLPPSCPYLFQWNRKHGKHSKSMDDGTRVHALVTGKGEEHLVPLPYENYRTKDAQLARDSVIAAGKVPALPHEMDKAQAIAEAVFADPEASRLLAGASDAELSMFWQEPEHGIWCRGRLDLLGWDTRPRAIDFKTAADASPEGFAKSLASFRYDMQWRHYCAGLAACLSSYPGEVTADDIAWSWITVQTSEPYIVMVYEPGPADAERADESLRIAYQTYAACSKAATWPKWSSSAMELSLPYYRAKQIERDINDYYL
jgi:hypothetical protein